MSCSLSFCIDDVGYNHYTDDIKDIEQLEQPFLNVNYINANINVTQMANGCLMMRLTWLPLFEQNQILSYDILWIYDTCNHIRDTKYPHCDILPEYHKTTVMSASNISVITLFIL